MACLRTQAGPRAPLEGGHPRVGPHFWASALPGLPLRDERLAFRGENRFEAGYFLHGLRGRGWARLKLGAVLISGVAPGFTVCVKNSWIPAFAGMTGRNTASKSSAVTPAEAGSSLANARHEFSHRLFRPAPAALKGGATFKQGQHPKIANHPYAGESKIISQDVTERIKESGQV